jgi:hypothetical protein
MGGNTWEKHPSPTTRANRFPDASYLLSRFQFRPPCYDFRHSQQEPAENQEGFLNSVHRCSNLAFAVYTPREDAPSRNNPIC